MIDHSPQSPILFKPCEQSASSNIRFKILLTFSHQIHPNLRQTSSTDCPNEREKPKDSPNHPAAPPTHHTSILSHTLNTHQ